MVSSTLKLGISILNGGNVEVQQVTDAQDLGKNGVGGMWRGGWVSPRSLQHPRLLPLPLQKMLDYLKDKKEVGFFQSIQALMQTCRWDPWPLSSSALLPPGLLLYPRPPGPGKGTEAEEHRC